MRQTDATQQTFWKKLRDRYRLALINEDTFEEVLSLRLTRKGIYISLCTIIVVMLVLAVSLLSFTPLKYYIPGYGDLRQRQEYIQLNMKVDSLENLVNARDQYLHDLKGVLRGDLKAELDTTRLKIPKVESTTN